MTTQKMLNKYIQMTKDNYETVFISQVIYDLYQIKRSRQYGKPRSLKQKKSH